MSGEALRQGIRKTAEEKARQVFSEAQSKADEITREAMAESKRILDARAREASRNLAQAEMAEAARARMDCTARLLNVKARYIEEAYRAAEAVIVGLPMANPTLYRSVLTNFINEAAEGIGGGRSEAVVREADRSTAEGIAKSIGSSLTKNGRTLTVSVSKEGLGGAGGVVLHSEDGKVYFINTFESRILKARDELRAKVGDALDGRR